MKKIFLILLLFSTNVLAHGPVLFKKESWKEIPPQEATVSIYDDSLIGLMPTAFRATGNIGTRIEGEFMFWEEEGLCALIAYAITGESMWGADATI